VMLFLFNKIHQHASVKEVTLLFLLSCLINTHTYVGLFDTFKWMKTTTERELFIAVLISCFTLLIFRSNRTKKILFYLLFSLIIVSVDLINVFQDLYSFKQWNHFYTFIYYSIFLWGLLFTLKWYRGLDSSSGSENNVVD
jgi:hypothetical protein